MRRGDWGRSDLSLHVPPTPDGPWISACIGLGSNIGDRAGHLAAGLAGLGTEGIRVVRASGTIETEPVGPIPQGPYLNAAALIETRLPAREMLERLLEIERSRGRDRGLEQRWGPRTLDLDLLLYGDAAIDEPGLTVPHPRLAERWFVLKPLAEVAPRWRVPGVGRTVEELLAAVEAAKGDG